MNQLKYIAKKNYKKFSFLDGNQHIAGPHAMEKLLKIVKINKIQSVLEVGIGIGSIASLIFEFCNNRGAEIRYVGTEKNAFCLSQLSKNLGKNYKHINIVDEIKSVEGLFDLIIVDGTDSNLSEINSLIKPHGVIFIEGCRSIQVKALRKLFPKSIYASMVSKYKNPDFGPFTAKNWAGGAQLIYPNPTNRQYLHWLNERLKTSFYYKLLRPIKNKCEKFV